LETKGGLLTASEGKGGGARKLLVNYLRQRNVKKEKKGARELSRHAMPGELSKKCLPKFRTPKTKGKVGGGQKGIGKKRKEKVGNCYRLI